MSNNFEEEARKMIESGGPAFNQKFSFTPGSGPYSSLATLIYGRNEEEYQRVMEFEAKAAAQAEQDKHPDIFKIKRGRQYSSDREQYERYQNNDLSIKSTHLSRQEFIELYNFISDANQEGYILNVGLTISWKMLGIENHKEATSLMDKGFIKHLKSWHAYRVKKRFLHPETGKDHPMLWCYVHENSPLMGFHTHMMLCIPQELIPQFKHWIRDRFQKLSKVQPAPKKAIKVSAPPSQSLKRQWIRFQYLCKGLDPREIIREENYEFAVYLLDMTQFHYRDPGLLDCMKKMGYAQRYDFAALHKEECEQYRYQHDFKKYKMNYRSTLGFRSALDKGIYDVRVLYPSSLDKMEKINEPDDISLVEIMGKEGYEKLQAHIKAQQGNPEDDTINLYIRPYIPGLDKIKV